MKNLLLAFVLLATPACAASSESTNSSDQSITAEGATIRDRSVVVGSLATGSLHMAYDPTEYTLAKPFIGAVVPSSAAARTINVAGNFPGAPDVLVVDHDFNVLASTQGVAAEAGNKVAKLSLSSVPRGALVLVRDEGWVQPMEFEVTMQ